MNSNTSLWTITHNSDFAVAYTGLIGNPAAIGEAFHITSDESVSWNEIYGYIADALGVALKPFYVSSQTLAALGKEYDYVGSLTGDKSNSVVFDNSKVKALVPEFSARVSAREGITRTVEYVMAHPEYQQEDEEFDRWCDDVIARISRLEG